MGNGHMSCPRWGVAAMRGQGLDGGLLEYAIEQAKVDGGGFLFWADLLCLKNAVTCRSQSRFHACARGEAAGDALARADVFMEMACKTNRSRC